MTTFTSGKFEKERLIKGDKKIKYHYINNALKHLRLEHNEKINKLGNYTGYTDDGENIINLDCGYHVDRDSVNFQKYVDYFIEKIGNAEYTATEEDWKKALEMKILPIRCSRIEQGGGRKRRRRRKSTKKKKRRRRIKRSKKKKRRRRRKSRK